MNNHNAEFWINKLELTPHPEGGFFKEVYRSSENIPENALPKRYKGTRTFCTSIYFLLDKNQTSAFHKLASDEIWNFYAGSSLTIYIIEENSRIKKIKLGNNPDAGEVLQYTIEKEQWFGAEVNDKNSFSLIGCTVAPGFDFQDFELGGKKELLKHHPAAKEIINRLTGV